MFCQSGSQSPSFDWITAVKGGGRVISRSQVPLTALGCRLSARSESVVSLGHDREKSILHSPLLSATASLDDGADGNQASRNREDWDLTPSWREPKEQGLHRL